MLVNCLIDSMAFQLKRAESCLWLQSNITWRSYLVCTCSAVWQTKPCFGVAQLAFVEGFPLSCPLGPEHDHSALRRPRRWKGGGRRGWSYGSGGENGRRSVFLWPSVAFTKHPRAQSRFTRLSFQRHASWSSLLENLLTSPHTRWHHTAVCSSASGNMSGLKPCH